MDAIPARIEVDANVSVSGLLIVPDKPKACFVLAHGAGAGMTHHLMAEAAAGLHDRGVATLRYQFPYMEKGSRIPACRYRSRQHPRRRVRCAKA